MLQIGSPLSFHLNPVGFTTNIITNIRELSIPPFTTHKLPKLHLSFISEEMMFSQRTGFSLKMNELFLPPFKLPSRTRNCKAITVQILEKQQKKLSNIQQCSRVFIRKRHFHTLAESFLNPNLESDLPAATRHTFRHGRIYEPVAREKYRYVMKFYLNRNIDIREVNCFGWLQVQIVQFQTSQMKMSDKQG